MEAGVGRGIPGLLPCYLNLGWTTNHPMTYAEKRGVKPFNWRQFLTRKKAPTHLEWVSAEYLAGKWVTCACGNQCAIIPRSLSAWIRGIPVDAPLDDELRSLGYKFSFAVQERRILDALNILIKIEKRSTQLIKQIKAEKKK